MARKRDEEKRLTIMETAKMLFSHQGFFNTSIADIVRDTGLPVGTIYTYFKSKDDIIRVIVQEGWEDFYTRLEEAMTSPSPGQEKLEILIQRFIPELLEDLDFINILLSEAIVYTRIEEKIEKITELLFSLINSLTGSSKPPIDLSKKSLETGLAVYFLGILNTVRIAKSSSIGIKVADVLDFIKLTTEYSLGIKL
jgi:AcrR family transcriptional regulator